MLLGFPGAGGTLQEHVVRYIIIHQQPTTVGEPDGRQSARLYGLAETLRASGFPTRRFLVAAEERLHPTTRCHCNDGLSALRLYTQCPTPQPAEGLELKM